MLTRQLVTANTITFASRLPLRRVLRAPAIRAIRRDVPTTCNSLQLEITAARHVNKHRSRTIVSKSSISVCKLYKSVVECSTRTLHSWYSFFHEQESDNTYHESGNCKQVVQKQQLPTCYSREQLFLMLSKRSFLLKHSSGLEGNPFKLKGIPIGCNHPSRCPCTPRAPPRAPRPAAYRATKARDCVPAGQPGPAPAHAASRSGITIEFK